MFYVSDNIVDNTYLDENYPLRLKYDFQFEC